MRRQSFDDGAQLVGFFDGLAPTVELARRLVEDREATDLACLKSIAAEYLGELFHYVGRFQVDLRFVQAGDPDYIPEGTRRSVAEQQARERIESEAANAFLIEQALDVIREEWRKEDASKGGG